jgi:hypothetical protein
MAHGIEITNMQARMAYADHSVPWHKLGTPVKGLQTIPDMLRAANADFDVVTAGVAVVDAEGNFLLNPDGSAILVKDSRATIRVNGDGTFNALSTVGTRYVVQQNREVLERALAVVGASKGDALIDTCGVLDGGREFFATLDLGAVYIDPNGNLVMDHRFGQITQSKLIAWAFVDGKRQDVAIRFEKSEGIVGLHFPDKLPKFDSLFIDPNLTFSTFTGSSADNWGFTATPDVAGNLYGAGIVFGYGYPTTAGAYDLTYNNGEGIPFDVGITNT